MKVKAGDVLFVPAGTIHLGKNVGSVNGAELATYIVEKGKPLITLVRSEGRYEGIVDTFVAQVPQLCDSSPTEGKVLK